MVDITLVLLAMQTYIYGQNADHLLLGNSVYTATRARVKDPDGGVPVVGSRIRSSAQLARMLQYAHALLHAIIGECGQKMGEPAGFQHNFPKALREFIIV